MHPLLPEILLIETVSPKPPTCVSTNNTAFLHQLSVDETVNHKANLFQRNSDGFKQQHQNVIYRNKIKKACNYHSEAILLLFQLVKERTRFACKYYLLLLSCVCMPRETPVYITMEISNIATNDSYFSPSSTIKNRLK